MRQKILKPLFFITIASLLSLPCKSQASAFSKHLDVTTSANSESNAAQSFVIVKEGEILIEGIKHDSAKQKLAQQIPLVIEYTKKLQKDINLQWIIKATDIKHGSINLLSRFEGNGRLFYSGYRWTSEILDESVLDRQRLVFRPKPFKHQPTIYKKGRGPHGKRSKYGGGTREIDVKKYNPKYAYDITLNVFRGDERIFTYKTHLEMDRKDMIRQEYINHYNIKRYNQGERGNIPVPLRSEISQVPPKPALLEGNPLTESQYDLVINDGMLELADKINKHYIKNIRKLRAKGGLLDLNKKKRKVPDNKLWLSSGWRNPERNEWYSNAVNGNHQRGGAVDVIIMAPANSLESSIGYWVLWNTLMENRKEIDGYWQLEKNGVPMKTREYRLDIEPKNGIPDAFDKADHLHANVNY